MSFVLRQIHPPRKSLLPDEATITAACISGTVQPGDYLEWSDPDANFGGGDDRWTSHLTDAKRFPTFDAAVECWKEQSTVRPLRSDGKPNRPMTAISVRVEEVKT
jgi:hypothetical protein